MTVTTSDCDTHCDHFDSVSTLTLQSASSPSLRRVPQREPFSSKPSPYAAPAFLRRRSKRSIVTQQALPVCRLVAPGEHSLTCACGTLVVSAEGRDYARSCLEVVRARFREIKSDIHTDLINLAEAQQRR